MSDAILFNIHTQIAGGRRSSHLGSESIALPLGDWYGTTSVTYATGIIPCMEHWNYTRCSRSRSGHECEDAPCLLPHRVMLSELQIPSGPEDLTARRAAPNHPLLEPLTAASLLISFISYNTTSVGSLGFLLCLGSGIIGLWGTWTVSCNAAYYVICRLMHTCYTDDVCRLFKHLTEDWSGQTNVAVSLREQGCRLCPEEALEERTSRAVEGSLTGRFCRMRGHSV